MLGATLTFTLLAGGGILQLSIANPLSSAEHSSYLTHTCIGLLVAAAVLLLVVLNLSGAAGGWLKMAGG